VEYNLRSAPYEGVLPYLTSKIGESPILKTCWELEVSIMSLVGQVKGIQNLGWLKKTSSFLMECPL